MHAVELERRLKLPGASKTLETLWKAIKRPRLGLEISARQGMPSAGSSPSMVIMERQKARVEAERRKSQGIQYAMRSIVR